MVVRNYVNADVITQYDVIGCNLHSCRNPRLLVVYTQGDRRSNCCQKSNMFDTSNCRRDRLLEVYTRPRVNALLGTTHDTTWRKVCVTLPS